MPTPATMVKLAKSLGLKIDEMAAKSPSEVIAQVFEQQTGQPIRTAGTRLAGQEMRRMAGKTEPDLYTPEQMALIDQWESMRYPSSKFLFHTTPSTNIPAIKQQGLLVDAPRRYPETSGKSGISLAASEGVAKYYGSPTDTLLRVSNKYNFPDLNTDYLAGGEGAYITNQGIPPQYLEVKQGRKWVPLTGLLGD